MKSYVVGMMLWVLSGVVVTAENVPGRVKAAARAKTSPGYTSCALVSAAWNAFNDRDYQRAMGLAAQCVKDYSVVAIDQQKSLREIPPPNMVNDYWALNDVATALFIRGRSLEKLNDVAAARMTYAEILKRYPHAQCWESKDIYWSVASASRDRIQCINMRMDFGDYKSSTLTSKGWDALKQGRLAAAQAYADKCIELYGERAREMQVSLRDFPSSGLEWEYWALNDVGTCLFIKGQALAKMGKEAEANRAFQDILGSYSYAQCWDTSGQWFWKLADAARKLLYKNKEI